MNQKSNSNLKTSEKIIRLQNSIYPDQQLYWIHQICIDDVIGQKALLELLINRRIIEKMNINCLDGILFETLYYSKQDVIRESVKNYFVNGLFQFDSLCSQSITDHQYLQDLLIKHNFQEADRFTQILLCKLVGLDKSSKRNWLYFTDISLIPSDDLKVIDLMWRMYSRDKFGFSRQRQIWLTNNCNWEKLWLKIEWKYEGVARRYPSEFMWNINAPRGHLPLFNQLRGVQTLSALFNHVAWNK
uniref:hypothetical protein n=1 Tax=Catenella fusiformis TaxID=3024791 RepID=UPI0027D9DDF2|nr:hypothetical protein REQ04_pgp185 [Catenella fusiformis]WCH57442.1 hypothetical protein [Catenella fusiformis]